MVEFDLDSLSGNIAVHCDTQEKYRELLKWINCNVFNIRLDSFSYKHKENTCILIYDDIHSEYVIDDNKDSFIRDKYKVISYEEALLKPTKKPIKQGDIVLAKRDDGFETQAVYYGDINGKYAVDFNGTSCMLVDSVELLPTYTKKEAKQKVSELFGNPKNVSSYEVRKIIDRIKN